MKILTLAATAVLLLLPNMAGAVFCSTIFPDTIQGRGATSELTFEDNAQVIGDPDNIFDFQNLDDKTGGGHNTCVTTDCAISGSTTPSLSLPAFLTTSTNTDVTIDSGSESIGPGGTYDLSEIDDLKIEGTGIATMLSPTSELIVTKGQLKDDSITTFNPGEYWFDDLSIEDSAQVIINGPVTIYVRGNLAIKDSALVNVGGAAQGLAIVGYGEIKIENDAIVKGVLYGEAKVEIKGDGQFTGAISTSGEVKIKDDGIVNYENVSGVAVGSLCTPDIDHYEIIHDGQGLTCEAESVTIRACMDGTCSTLSTSSITLDFQADGVTKSSPTFTGSTVVSLSHTTVETLTLSTANETLSAPSALVCSDGSGSSCDIDFVDAGFRFLYGAANSTTVPTQVAGGSFADALKVQAVQNTSGVCTGLFTGNVATELAQQSINPGNVSTLDFTVNAAVIAKNPSSGVSAYTTVTLNYGASSIAVIPVPVYQDAGQIRVHANYDVGGVTLSGSSNAFWVRPDKLIVTAKSGGTDLDATTATGLPVHAAGANFDLEITARNTGAVTTPNYQAGQIQFRLERTGPSAGGADGSLTYAPASSIASSLAPAFQNVSTVAFISGVSSYGSARHSEVGLLNLDLQDSNYGGAAITVPGDAIDVGRFTPDHFTVSAVTPGGMQAACSVATPFTYVGEDFGYSVAPVVSIEPYEATGASVTQNYEGSFRHLTAPEITLVFPTVDGTNGLAVTNVATGGVLSEDGDGTMSYTLSLLDQYNYTRTGATEIAPFVSDLTVNVTAIAETLDGVNATGLPEAITPTGTEIRFGRLVVNNAFGSEVVSLPVPVFTEYYAASATYEAHTDDGCSDPVSLLTTLPDSAPSGSHNNIPVAGGSTDLTYSSPVVAGDGGFVLSAPGATNVGDIDFSFDLSSTVWLQYDWDGDGSLDSNPVRTVTFGQYRGHDRVIFWQEVLP